jgi:hypoxanthine phosphoribosyltransferase
MKHKIETLISQQEVESSVLELAKKIEETYAHTESLIMIGLLKGSVIFMSDLARAVKKHVEIDFMSVSSYGTAMESSRDVKILKDVQSNIEGKEVLLVEDIIDSGHTLFKVKAMLETRNPKSLRICTLLNKEERREVHVPVDFVGFTIPDEFVVGYGIDYAEMYRNLNYIAKVIPLEE